MTFGCPMVSDVRAGKVFRIESGWQGYGRCDVQSDRSVLGVLPDGDLLGATMTQRLIVKFGAEKPAVPDQRVASMAACAFAPKLATQTLNNADHNMGPAAWEPRCQSIETRMAGGCRVNDAHPMDAKRKQMASVPAVRSGSEDDMRRDACRIRVLVNVM